MNRTPCFVKSDRNKELKKPKIKTEKQTKARRNPEIDDVSARVQPFGSITGGRKASMKGTEKGRMRFGNPKLNV